jgi:hypothetical protein
MKLENGRMFVEKKIIGFKKCSNRGMGHCLLLKCGRMIFQLPRGKSIERGTREWIIIRERKM